MNQRSSLREIAQRLRAVAHEIAKEAGTAGLAGREATQIEKRVIELADQIYAFDIEVLNELDRQFQHINDGAKAHGQLQSAYGTRLDDLEAKSRKLEKEIEGLKNGSVQLFKDREGFQHAKSVSRRRWKLAAAIGVPLLLWLTMFQVVNVYGTGKNLYAKCMEAGPYVLAITGGLFTLAIFLVTKWANKEPQPVPDIKFFGTGPA